MICSTITHINHHRLYFLYIIVFLLVYRIKKEFQCVVKIVHAPRKLACFSFFFWMWLKHKPVSWGNFDSEHQSSAVTFGLIKEDRKSNQNAIVYATTTHETMNNT